MSQQQYDPYAGKKPGCVSPKTFWTIFVWTVRIVGVAALLLVLAYAISFALIPVLKHLGVEFPRFIP